MQWRQAQTRLIAVTGDMAVLARVTAAMCAGLSDCSKLLAPAKTMAGQRLATRLARPLIGTLACPRTPPQPASHVAGAEAPHYSPIIGHHVIDVTQISVSGGGRGDSKLVLQRTQLRISIDFLDY